MGVRSNQPMSARSGKSRLLAVTDAWLIDVKLLLIKRCQKSKILVQAALSSALRAQQEDSMFSRIRVRKAALVDGFQSICWC